MEWTSALDDRLVKLWNEGNGFKQIAVIMRTTVGTIAGRKHRLEREGRKMLKRTSPIARKSKPSVMGIDYMANVNGCRAILDQRSGPYHLPMVCGLPRGTTVNGGECSYCPMHYAQFNYISQARGRYYG